MSRIIEKIFNEQCLLDQPPVLVDIGASGGIHPAWKLIAKYSICLAFDADVRDFRVSEVNHSGFKKLILINRMLAAEAGAECDFYLTKSPHCSSSLLPDVQSLKPWAFRNLFDLQSVVQIPAVRLDDAMNNCGVDYIDWYKTDSQGTDLRIFKSLSELIQGKIIAAEFEPGILDSYYSEDKLYDLMKYMDGMPFWVTDMVMKGSQRIFEYDQQLLSRLQVRYLSYFLRTPPACCEIAYFNNFEGEFSRRDFLLGWVIATLKKEHGFAMHIARLGFETTDDPIFMAMRQCSLRAISSPIGYLKSIVKYFAFMLTK